MIQNAERVISAQFVSIVIPVMNEEECIPHLVIELFKALEPVVPMFEIIFVDDGSCDHSVSIIETLIEKHSQVKLVKLSRNMGHQAALCCGLGYASGDIVISMDADLQHPPGVLPQLLDLWVRGFDVVNTSRRASASTTFLDRLGSRLFYKLFNRIGSVGLVQGGSDFRLMDKKVVEAVKAMPEYHKFIRGQIQYVGFLQTTFIFDCPQRFAGTRSYSLKQSLNMALNGIFSYSEIGLRIPVMFGFAGFFIACMYLLVVIVRSVLGHQIVTTGWLSIVSILAMMFAVQVMFFGVIAGYIGKVFLEVKSRPAYFVDRKVGFDQDNRRVPNRAGASAETQSSVISRDSKRTEIETI